MFSVSDMNSSASKMFSAYASFAASMMMVRSLANEIIPPSLRSYLFSAVGFLFAPLSSTLTIVVNEKSGIVRNQVYDAAETYLSSKISPSTQRISVSKTPRQKKLCLSVEKDQDIVDHHRGVRLTWRLFSTDPEKNSYSRENRFFELSFDKKFHEIVMDSYLPYVLERAMAIRDEGKVVKLYNRQCPSDEECGGRGWGSVNLEHPSTFETLAMDPDLKKSIMDDLDRFLKRKEFYKRVGKAWKRGYLLYGPPGTGKSSLIAAIANYLKFDVYDLELTSIYSNADLRNVFLSTTNRSIVVIEDIDCSKEAHDRQYYDPDQSSDTKMTLSGLLNFIDGLWSSCGDERIIVFTTNHKDRLDPALLRPGRMDVQINMSYCTVEGFKQLASNYLGGSASNHPLCGEIEKIMEITQVTPAEVAEELMKNDTADLALQGLANFLKRKNIEDETKNVEEDETNDHVPAKKKLKTVGNVQLRSVLGRKGRGRGRRRGLFKGHRA